MDEIINQAKLEEEFITLAVKEHGLDLAKLSGKRLERFARYSALAFRCNMAGMILGLDARGLSMRAADSPLLQWFLRIGAVDKIKAPSKSAVDRFSRWISEAGLRRLNDKLMGLLALSPDAGQPAPFNLKEAIRFDEMFFDATCLKANIHFPVDWVLLRDIARTLMKATVLIRQAGLKERMPQEPLAFLSEMNTLCMKMSAQRRHPDSKKRRKKVLREMKALEKRIAAHARAHREALSARREETELSEGQARVIIERIDNVLEQLPAAIKQAHERLIGGRQVANEDKILSLYDKDISIIVRGKAEAEVEFGNKFWLGETREGLIADYKLLRENPADSALLRPAIARVVDGVGLPLKIAWADRGVMSAAGVKVLDTRGIRSGLCPRDPEELAQRLVNEEGFREGMKRRASTEARIGIFKNVFVGQPARAKSFEHREQAVGNAVLAHNLWVLARLPQVEERSKAATRPPRPSPGAQRRAA